MDLSEDGPVFNALDEMMLKMLDQDNAERNNKAGGSKGDEAKKCLKNLLRSGIPGIEGMFATPGGQQQGNKRSGTNL